MENFPVDAIIIEQYLIGALGRVCWQESGNRHRSRSRLGNEWVDAAVAVATCEDRKSQVING